MKIKATPYQERFWCEWLLDKNSSAYNTPLVYECIGNFEKELLIKAIDFFVNKHDIGCRSVFFESDSILYQKISNVSKIEIIEIYTDIDYLQTKITECAHYQFNLQNGPLFKIFILQTETQKFLIFNFHHIISDAKSAVFFMQAIRNLYSHYKFGTNIELISESRNIQDWLIHDNYSNIKEHTEYWGQKLDGSNVSNRFLNFNTHLLQNTEETKQYFDLDVQTYNKLMSFCKKKKCTLFIFFSAAFSVLLSDYCYGNEILLNYPVDSRNRIDKDQIGCFINNFLLYIRFKPKDTLDNILHSIITQRKATKSYNRTTLTEVYGEYVSRDNFNKDAEPFNIGITEAYFNNETIEITSEFFLQPVQFDGIDSALDLMFAYQKNSESISCRFDYSKKIFSTEHVSSLVNHFKILLAYLLENPDAELDKARSDCINALYKLYGKYPVEMSFRSCKGTVVESFRTVVKQYPENIAVSYNDRQLTYLELSEKVDSLSRRLTEKIAVIKDCNGLVGVCLHRNDLLPISLLAILHSNMAYIPIPPNLPSQYIKKILDNSGISLLITTQELQQNFTSANIEIFTVDHTNLLNNQIPTDQKNEPYTCNESDLAYVLYTSGTTGEPKGVMIEHHSLQNTIESFKSLLNVQPNDIILGSTNYSFDIFGLELFLPLTSGAKLHLLTDAQLEDTTNLVTCIKKINPTIMQGTPSFWRLLFTINLDALCSMHRNLRIICGGEPLTPQIAEKLLQVSNAVYQVYGPTETTIWSSLHRLTNKDQASIIGKPIDNTVLSIFNAEYKVVPFYVEGELFISGNGVARGYHNNKSLTNELFIEDENKKIIYYKTGDKAVLNINWDISFIGRNDNQIKLRGYRVELNAIETTLNNLNYISQAIVKAELIGDELAIIAYYVLENKNTVNKSKIATDLSLSLPTYMLPSLFIEVENFKVTRAGKVDRKNLSHGLYQTKEIGVPHATNKKITEKLRKIWISIFSIEDINFGSDFFELGGHSIIAIKLIMDISKKFHVDINISDLKQASSLFSLAKLISERVNSKDKKNQTSVKNVSVSNSLSALSFQQIDLIHSINKTTHSLNRYNICVVQRISINLKINYLEEALRLVFNRHDIFKWNFKDSSGGDAVNVIFIDHVDHFLPIKKIKTREIEQSIQDETKYIFNLSEPPYYKITLFETDKEYFLFIVIHHLLIDGWGLNVIKKEVSLAYNALQSNKKINFPKDNLNYRQYVQAQNDFFCSAAYSSSLEKWSKYLSNIKPNILFYEAANIENDLSCGSIQLIISKSNFSELKIFLKKNKLSLYNYVFSCLSILLTQYLEQTDLVIWSPVAGRSEAWHSGMIGLFTYLLPFISHSTGCKTVLDILNSNKDMIHDVLSNELVKTSDLTKLIKDACPSFDFASKVVLTLQNANDSFNLSLEKTEVNYYEVVQGFIEYPIFVNLRETNGTVTGHLHYHSKRFSSATMQMFAKQLEELFSQAYRIQSRLSDIDFLKLFDKHEPPQFSSKEQKELSKRYTLLQLIEQQLIKYPDNVAVKNFNTTLTYKELEKESTRYAQYLYSIINNDNDLNEEHKFIGLCLEPSIELIILILAIMKIGFAYVPLDPNAPLDRIRYIANDSNIKYLISSQKFDALDTDNRVTKIYIETLIQKNESAVNIVLPDISPDSLIYMIYTSGSTGQPKGTLTTHYNVSRLFTTIKSSFNFNSTDVWCLFHSYAFDFSVWEIFGALSSGACLVIPTSMTVKDIYKFHDLLVTEKITILNQTPTAFARLVAIDTDFKKLESLRYIIFGGELLQYSSLEPWFARYKDSVKLINMYGITETTVHVTFKEVDQEAMQFPWQNNIGMALKDLRPYVINEHKMLCATGVPGELFVAGAGVAKGYYKRDDLTAERFIVGTDLGIKESILYKTGDKVKWLANRELAYIGRTDNQIKIRGYRIQLEEVVTAVLSSKLVINAHVAYSEEKSALIVFLVPNTQFEQAAFYSAISRALPEYMLPKFYCVIPSLPRTANDKIDESQLLKMDLQLFTDGEYEEPKTLQEKIIAECWKKLFSLNIVSCNDNFFSLGGDSISLLTFMTALKQKGYSIDAEFVYKTPQLNQIASLLKPIDQNTAICHNISSFQLVSQFMKHKLEKQFQDVCPLTKLQEGLIFHSNASGEQAIYIDLISCNIAGKFSFKYLQQALSALAKAHSMLRTVFIMEDNKYYQAVMFEPAIDITEVNLSNEVNPKLILESRLKKIRRKRLETLNTAPWKILIHHLDSCQYNIALICHHAILDGWSVALFFESLLSIYDRFLSGINVNILENKFSFSDYVANEIKVLGDELPKTYWKNQLKLVPDCNISRNSNSRNLNYDIDKVTLEIPKNISSALKVISNKAGKPIDVILLAVHIYSLSAILGRNKIMTGVTTNARLEVDDSQNMMGLFLNSLPIVCNMHEFKTWYELVNYIFHKKIEFQAYKQYPMNQILVESGRYNLFDTLFNFVDFHVLDKLHDLNSIKVEESLCIEDTNFNFLTHANLNLETKQLDITFKYNKVIISDLTVNKFSQIFTIAMHNLADNINNEILSAELENILTGYFPSEEWNKTNTPLPKEETVYDLFYETAKNFSSNTALIEKDKKFTYHQLSNLVDNLRNYFIENQKLINPGDFIAIFIPRRLEAVISCLVILSFGGIYVPIDPSHPKHRLKYYIHDSQAKYIIVDSTDADLYSWTKDEYPEKLISWPSCINTTMGHESTAVRLKNVSRTDLAYMMYTSGSTGQPKGVTIEQQGIIRLVKNTNYIQFSNEDVVALTSNFSFDVSTFEIWGALLNGATLVIVPQDILLDTILLEKYIREHSINIMWLTARLFDQLLMLGSDTLFTTLECLMVGGDVLSKEWISKLLKNKHGRPKRLINGYGPTENTTFTTYYDIGEEVLSMNSIPIGKPISNTKTYIVDDDFNILPVGEIGELCTSGLGVARSYFNAAEKTADKFVTVELFCPVSRRMIKERIYRTGDLARWLPDGNIEFFGRKDRNVKITGYQVNLDELEQTITALPEVKTCRVIFKREPRKQLLCYYIQNAPCSIQNIKSKLLELIPNYMIPNIFIKLDSLPLSENGKVFDDKLPKPEVKVESEESGQNNTTAKILRAIWNSILEHDAFGDADKFFDIGGNSLLSMQVHASIAKQLYAPIAIADIFRYPTIDSLAEFIDSKQIAVSVSDAIEQSKQQRERNSNIRKRQKLYE